MSHFTTLLEFLYPQRDAHALEKAIRARMNVYAAAIQNAALSHSHSPIAETTALLITYGDQVTALDENPLRTLAAFLETHIKDVVSAVHLLPFYPSSSDDGFAVMDYYAVAPELGTWDDIARIGQHFDLMFDAVINHVSAQGKWFQEFLRDAPPYRDYFIVPPREWDAQHVIRPRALPLFTRFQTATSEKSVWTTFSADQVDLNYENPELLVQIIDVLLFYVAQGAHFIRLDAIAFLWKASSTSCLHLPQTHVVIQLLRAILNELAPYVILVTETNVPHADNISYFGDGANEAHWVYNFALPPLTLHTLQTGDAAALSRWAQTLTLSSDQTAFFNFLASHDGIGLNPARGILRAEEMDALVARTFARGGLVGYKHNTDGTTSPYELNINYFDALAVPGEEENLSIARFVCAHAIMLALRGVPGIYFHSLFGSRGDRQGADTSGIPRRINRQKFARAELERELAQANSRRARIFASLAALLRARQSNAAFQPNAPQTILDAGPDVFAILRASADSSSRVFCVQNVTERGITVLITVSPEKKFWKELRTGEIIRPIDGGTKVELAPYQVCWLSDSDGQGNA